MKALDTPLIANISKRQLSALGYKQLSRIIDKACEANNTHRFAKESKQLKQQVETLVMALIFDMKVTKEQLSYIQKNIRVINNRIQIPSITKIAI